ncbi:MAG TPA: DinB family protein [Thermomicrobiales bacterium]|jgi:hypothetical protein|nr:DinB family protein [Thermomicrobiales bacterium]
MSDSQTIPVQVFIDGMLSTLKELFEEVPSPSMMLDRGDAWFQTLDGISAEEASIPAASGISNIAAEVNHAAFYIDVTLEYIRGGQPSADWDGSWKVGTVDAAEWDALKAKLRSSYDELREIAANPAGWTMDGAVMGGIATVGHCAYHLGEVRRTLGVIRGGGGVRA